VEYGAGSGAVGDLVLYCRKDLRSCAPHPRGIVNNAFNGRSYHHDF